MYHRNSVNRNGKDVWEQWVEVPVNNELGTVTSLDGYTNNGVFRGTYVDGGVLADVAGTSIAIIECLPCKTGAGENNGYVIGYGEGEEWSDSGVEVYLSPINPLDAESELYLCKLEKDATYMPGIFENA